jgi:hypothetical protein
MKLTLQSTTKVVELEVAGGGIMPARTWEGVTESGIKVHCFIARVAVREGENMEQFDTELRQCKTPTPAVAAIPLRLIV